MIGNKQLPIRILQVVGKMNRGGAETWLMHILKNIDRDRFHIDFLVDTTQQCAYDDEIRNLGSQIIPCLNPLQPLLYSHNFKSMYRKYGSYDIVHSHVHHFSGYILLLAQQVGVPIRIVHSHIDSSALEAKSKIHRRLYLGLMKSWLTQYATSGLGCSHKALADLFSPNWESDPRWRLLYCGIDLNTFKKYVDSSAVRAELGLPTDAFVIGHVGRFQDQKNHRFILDIAAEIAKQEPRMRLLLIGDGILRQEIEQKAEQLGLINKIIFAGIRSDVAQLMIGAMDVFLFPSLYEGLPLVLLEAQSAGVPCVISDVITEEVEVLKPFLRRLSLMQSASVWAKAILAIKSEKLSINREDALNQVTHSAFNIQRSVQELSDVYTSLML